MTTLWLIYFLITLTGYLTLGYGFPKLRPWERVILGFLVGTVFYMAYLNTWVHLFGYLSGVYLCMASMILQSGWVVAKKYKLKATSTELEANPNSPPLKAYQVFCLFLVLSVQVGIVILNNNMASSHDGFMHGTTFAQFHKFHLSYPVDTFYRPAGGHLTLVSTAGHRS